MNTTTAGPAAAAETPKEPPPAYTPANNNEIGWGGTPEEGQAKKRGLFGVSALGGGSATRTRWALSDRFDRALPPHKRYFGRFSRRVLLIGVGVLLLLLLALIIGLAVGLGGKGKKQNLPLPNGKETYEGDLTYYGVGLGACGVTATDDDAIVAISHYTFDAAQTGSDPNQNPLCGRMIRARRGDASIDVKVIDRCTGCQPTDLDVSLAMFKKLADQDLGRVTVEWAWL